MKPGVVNAMIDDTHCLGARHRCCGQAAAAVTLRTGCGTAMN